jgi:hypothetical protein
MQHESPFSLPGTPDQNQVSVAFVQIWLRHCPLGLRLAAGQVENNRKNLAAEHVSGSDFQLLGPLGLAEVFDFLRILYRAARGACPTGSAATILHFGNKLIFKCAAGPSGWVGFVDDDDVTCG